jgi:hypothetical protein
MFLLDSLLVGGLRFVLDKVATIADQELNDPERQRERLLEAQMRLETGEIDQAEFDTIEADVFQQIRQIKARTQSQDLPDEDLQITGVEITVADEAE